MYSPFSRALRPLTPALLAVAFLFAGCDSSDPDGGPDGGPGGGDRTGTFDATVTGARQVELDGIAAFADDLEGETGEIGFGVGLVSERGDDSIVLVGVGELAERTYALTAEEDEGEAAGLFFASAQGEEGALYVAASGTLTVTDVEDDRLRGRFEFEGVNVVDETDEVSVSGTFNALRGSVEVSERHAR